VVACAVNDTTIKPSENNNSELAKKPEAKIQKPKKKKYINRNSVSAVSNKNILVTNLATDDQDIGTKKLRKIEAKCSLKGQCVKLIQNKIINLWDFPRSYPKFKTILVLELSDEGHITTIRLKRSSGKRDFDDSVLKAVRQAAPFSEILYLPANDLVEFSSIEMVFKR
jgi:outer membrane biosynthesis protein TonB